MLYSGEVQPTSSIALARSLSVCAALCLCLFLFLPLFLPLSPSPGGFLGYGHLPEKLSLVHMELPLTCLAAV